VFDFALSVLHAAVVETFCRRAREREESWSARIIKLTFFAQVWLLRNCLWRRSHQFCSALSLICSKVALLIERPGALCCCWQMSKDAHRMPVFIKSFCTAGILFSRKLQTDLPHGMKREILNKTPHRRKYFCRARCYESIQNLIFFFGFLLLMSQVDYAV
jgi:hypothetical protein